jgi:hypothetical protein
MTHESFNKESDEIMTIYQTWIKIQAIEEESCPLMNILGQPRTVRLR